MLVVEERRFCFFPINTNQSLFRCKMILVTFAADGRIIIPCPTDMGQLCFLRQFSATIHNHIYL